jgi:hypothetical protein
MENRLKVRQLHLGSAEIQRCVAGGTARKKAGMFMKYKPGPTSLYDLPGLETGKRNRCEAFC